MKDTGVTCDNCWDGKHYKCHGCPCSVCKARGRFVLPPKPKPTPKKRTVSTKPRATKKPAVKRDPDASRVQTGGPITAMTIEQRREVRALYVGGMKVPEIMATMGESRHHIRAEVARIRRGVFA